MVYLSPTYPKNMRDGTVTLTDGTGLPNTITLIMLEGDVSWEVKQNVFPVFDRGTFIHLRQGDQDVCTVSFSVKYTGCFTDAGETETLYEALTKTGEAAAWTSTTAATSDVYTLNVAFTYNDPGTAATNETLTFPNFAFTSISFKEGDEYNTLSVSGIAGCVKPTGSTVA